MRLHNPIRKTLTTEDRFAFLMRQSGFRCQPDGEDRVRVEGVTGEGPRAAAERRALATAHVLRVGVVMAWSGSTLRVMICRDTG